MDRSHDNLVDALCVWANEVPDRIAFRILTGFGQEVEEISFADLHRDALHIAAHLTPITVPGDRAVLVFSSNAGFIRAFFGCLYCGVVPVPASPPSLRGTERASSILTSCSPSVVLTNESVGGFVKRRLDDLPILKRPTWLHVEDVLKCEVNPIEPVRPMADEAAFVQYTSGSTSSPRGVVVSHGNLVHNCTAMALGFGFDSDTLRPVSWLPLFHDMGLVGHVINPIYLGVTSTLMPALDFLQKPVCWLSALGDYLGTLSLSPNFAYDLCVDRVSDEQKNDLDLSDWRWAANGAEPVRFSTMERFYGAFARCGFEMRSFFPSYGLAEATLYVTGGPEMAVPDHLRADRAALRDNRVVEVSDDVSGGVTLVSSGQMRRDSEMKIVDPDSTRVCLDMEVGEIWLRGPSIAKGYLDDEEETAITFGASLDDGEPFLRTGDLGFTRDGYLFICGRVKDLIILNGLNHHPRDLELSIIGCHDAIRGDSAVAFSVDIEEREALVMTCEIKRSATADLDREALMGAMRERIFVDHGVKLSEVVLLREGSTPKTTSGKMRRSECRYLFENGGLLRLEGG